MKPSSRRAVQGAAILLGLLGGALVAATVASTGPNSNPFAGLTDDESAAYSKTAVAESATARRERAIEFARSGRSLDELPRVEHQADSVLEGGTLETAAVRADVIVLVTSEGGLVDERGVMKLRLQVEQKIKGVSENTIDVFMYGGPRFTPDGNWVLAVAPYEAYLERGERAVRRRRARRRAWRSRRAVANEGGCAGRSRAWVRRRGEQDTGATSPPMLRALEVRAGSWSGGCWSVSFAPSVARPGSGARLELPC